MSRRRAPKRTAVLVRGRSRVVLRIPNRALKDTNIITFMNISIIIIIIIRRRRSLSERLFVRIMQVLPLTWDHCFCICIFFFCYLIRYSRFVQKYLIYSVFLMYCAFKNTPFYQYSRKIALVSNLALKNTLLLDFLRCMLILVCSVK